MMEPSNKQSKNFDRGGDVNNNIAVKLMFSKKLTESDVLHALHLQEEFGEMFMALRDKQGFVSLNDLQTGSKWRFHLRFSPTDVLDCKYAFDKGWLEFVKANNLVAGESVVIFEQSQVPKGADSHLLPHLGIICVARKHRPRPAVHGTATDKSNKSNVTAVISFDHMCRTIMSLEETRHVAIVSEESCENDYSKQRSLVMLFQTGKISEECVDCLLCLSIFPKDYEIERDTMIQFWMACGFLKELGVDEDVGVSYFDALQSHGYVSFTMEDHRTGKLWYKVNDLILSKEMLAIARHVRVDGDGQNIHSLMITSPRHVTVQRLGENIKVLERFAEMEMLCFLHGHQPVIKHVPYSLFVSLKKLRILNLSETKISELPSSVANLSSLHYLDLSKTLIKQLPNSIVRLQKLQTLKLQNCRHLVVLPKNTSNLTSLRHLDFGTHCHLNSMPPEMGKLTSLHTLSEFIAHPHTESSIAELENLRNLEGMLCLSHLECVVSRLEAMRANLRGKPFLRKLDFRWHPRQRYQIFDILSCLQPHKNLQQLRILGYGGSSFPDWISDPSFQNLTSVALIGCKHCTILPCLGQLPSLQSLTLDGLMEVRLIDFQFCCKFPLGVCEQVSFPKLQNLTLTSMLNLEVWLDMGKVWQDMGKASFPSLLKLMISDCPKLVSLYMVSSFQSLRHLEIAACPLLPSLPEVCLPDSVEKLVIEDCPLLKLSCSKPHGQDWPKVEHVRSVWIDYEPIS